MFHHRGTEATEGSSSSGVLEMASSTIIFEWLDADGGFRDVVSSKVG